MYVSMKEMLKKANEGYYAVMAINCFNLETIRAVITAAALEKAPIIVNIVQDHLVRHCDSGLIAPVVKILAERADVEVALNLDHGTEYEYITQAMINGFSSVMVDASRYDLKGNIEFSKKIVEFAKEYNVSVEGEIGCMGTNEDGSFTQTAMYSDPDEAKLFAEETGVDALAISFGSSHGNYPDGIVPKFDFQRLKVIKDKTKVPLVLHGGSGSGEDNILQAVQFGINKINVGCDFFNACAESTKVQFKENPDKNYFELIHQVEKDSIEKVRYYIRLAGSSDKSI
ncbi:class II fructose-bisphosphate aldolase [Pelosinus fermentans]|uniref:Ketose-bisphosphate aldolase n=1 Tax=Pelosinus fermentans JBW45 TaxID=1192197 RepID=I9DEW9_9FIRM|nr:class II fructose-bisphosphate aldolase [Pelosinus fermentans]AJQ29679.1 ketose-bisphosphate aldolase [Pelosinus fermentans JBW45]